MQFQKECGGFLQFCSVERRLSQHTISAYSSTLLDFGRWLPAERLLEEVNENDLLLYLDDMVSGRNSRRGDRATALGLPSRLLSASGRAGKSSRPIWKLAAEAAAEKAATEGARPFGSGLHPMVWSWSAWQSARLPDGTLSDCGNWPTSWRAMPHST